MEVEEGQVEDGGTCRGLGQEERTHSHLGGEDCHMSVANDLIAINYTNRPYNFYTLK